MLCTQKDYETQDLKELTNPNKYSLLYKIDKGPINKHLMNLFRVNELTESQHQKLVQDFDNPFFAANEINMNLNLNGVFDLKNELKAINNY